MLSLPQIDAVAADVAAASLPSGALIRAESRLYDGMDGDQLRVMVVVRDSEFPHITGQHALKLIWQLQQRLQADGEDRFATVEFATDEELAADGGA